MTDLQLFTQVSSLPADLKKDVSDFVKFLKQKAKPKIPPKKRQLGAAEGLIAISPDFDEPLENFKDYM